MYFFYELKYTLGQQLNVDLKCSTWMKTVVKITFNANVVNIDCIYNWVSLKQAFINFRKISHVCLFLKSAIYMFRVQFRINVYPFISFQDYYIMQDMVMKTLGTASWSLLMLQIHIGLKIVCVYRIYWN